MKATDLMIGDWVSLKEMPTLYMRVRSVLSNGSIEVQQYEGHPEFETMGLVPERISPILLTPEILEKNGFYKEDDGWRVPINYEFAYINIDDYQMLSYINMDYGDEGLTFTCQYVHQLQHFLRLLNIEKEVVC